MADDIDFDNMTDEQFEAYEKTTLMAPDDMAELVEDVSNYIRGDMLEDGLLLPRFGLLTLKARRTPLYCYGHPDIKKRFPKSFTDGSHIFLSDDYLRTLSAEEDASAGSKEGVIPLVLHHLLHMTMNHHRRFANFPKPLANIACDISVFCKLKLAFPEMRWVDSLLEDFPASSLPEPDVKRYAKLAEETIIRELSARYQQAQDAQDAEESDEEGEPDPNAKPQPGQKGQKGKKGEKGDESGDGDPSEDGDEALDEALEQMGMKGGAPSEDDHMMSLKEMAEMAEELGLSTTQERLDLPPSGDAEKIAEKEKEIRTRDVEDISKSVRMAGKAGTVGGGHLEGAAHEEVLKETEGKLSWKLGLQEMLGESMKFGYSEEEPGALYFIDPADMGLRSAVYVGSELPVKSEAAIMVLMDSSGSITSELFKEFIAEVFGIMRNQNHESSQASEIVLLFADDVLRGKPIHITEANIDEMMSKKLNVQGRGGNDIGGTIRQACALDEFKDRKIQGLVYFTDLGDTPPKKTDVPEGIPLAFVCPPNYYQEEFIRAVKTFARVYPIEEGLSVDLTREGYLDEVETKTKVKKGWGGW